MDRGAVFFLKFIENKKMEKRKELNLGYSDFKNIIRNDNYYVDKSLLIEEILNIQKTVLLLPRPRRFGKTLNLSMLNYFFDKKEPENIRLFSDLKIWKNQEIIEKHCCKYPVIYLSFKDAKAETWQQCYELIIPEIANQYRQHIYLLKDDVLHDFEKLKFNKILNETASEADYQGSLKLLSRFLHRYHQKEVVILIDEYDTPIQASHNKFYLEAVSFMRTLLSGAYKDNTSLYKGIITGILRVSKESIFTGLNNISVYSIFDTPFSDKFGFTEKEVKQIILDFYVETEYVEIKKWYNGYRFGKTEDIYNPWSILNYVLTPKDGFKLFWSNTSANELIKNEIKKKDANRIREEILELLRGRTVTKDLEENFVFTDFNKRKSLFWTLLTYSGYLTSKKQVSLGEYELMIPNYELEIVFKKTILEWFETEIKIEKYQLIEALNHLINKEERDSKQALDLFEKAFNQIIGDTFSYYDTTKNHEYVYHSYVLGLLAIIGDDYLIKSNKESGEGRYDIMLIPYDKTKTGVVIEIKQIEKQREKEKNEDFVKRIDEEIELAVNQIDRNKYYKELIDNQIEKNKIIKVPIIFAGKEPYITKQS